MNAKCYQVLLGTVIVYLYKIDYIARFTTKGVEGEGERSMRLESRKLASGLPQNPLTSTLGIGFTTNQSARKCLETHAHTLKQDTGGDLMRCLV